MGQQHTYLLIWGFIVLGYLVYFCVSVFLMCIWRGFADTSNEAWRDEVIKNVSTRTAAVAALLGRGDWDTGLASCFLEARGKRSKLCFLCF